MTTDGNEMEVLDETSSTLATTSASPSPGPALLRYVEDPRELLAGNAVRLLKNGAETFPAWLAAIDSARDRVSLEMYIFNDNNIDQQFASALIRAVAHGVHVRLLYDYMGCRDT